MRTLAGFTWLPRVHCHRLTWFAIGQAGLASGGAVRGASCGLPGRAAGGTASAEDAAPDWTNDEQEEKERQEEKPKLEGEKEH